jgi:hypothetical protein
VRQFPYCIQYHYYCISFLKIRARSAKRDYVHPRDRTARTEPKTRCPTRQLPRGEITFDNNRALKAGEGANRGRAGGDKRRPLVQHGPRS